MIARFVDEFAKMEAGNQNAVQLGKLEGHLTGLINTYETAVQRKDDQKLYQVVDQISS